MPTVQNVFPTLLAVRAASYWARRFHRRLACVGIDQADAVAAAVAHCLLRWRHHDPARSAPQTFLDRVAKSGLLLLLEEACAKKRGRRLEHVVIDDLELPCSRAPDVDLGHDLYPVLAALEPEDLRVADVLADHPVAEAARVLGLPRTTLRRRIAHLRARFEAAGLHAYLEAA